MPQGGQNTSGGELAEVRREHETHGPAKAAAVHGVDHHRNQQHEQQWHKHVHGFLKPGANAPTDDKHDDGHEHGMPHQQFPGIGQQPAELAANGLGIGTGKQSGRSLADIDQRPAANYGVKRQHQERGNNAIPADRPPASGGAFGFGQGAHGRYRALSAPAANHGLGNQNRHADQEDAGQVDQNEGAAAVLSGNVWKLPDVPEAYRRAGSGQDKRHP